MSTCRARGSGPDAASVSPPERITGKHAKRPRVCGGRARLMGELDQERLVLLIQHLIRRRAARSFREGERQ